MDNDAAVNHVGADSVSALFLCIQNGHLSCAECLLKAGADPNICGAGSDTSAATTPETREPAKNESNATTGCIEPEPTISLHQRRRTTPPSLTATSSSSSSFTCLYSASQRGDLHAVQLLLFHGATPSTTTSTTGYAPLHTAAANGHRRVVECLLHAGASRIGRTDEEGAEGAGGGVIDAAALADSNGHEELAAILRDYTATEEDRTKHDMDRGWMKYIKNAFHH